MHYMFHGRHLSGDTLFVFHNLTYIIILFTTCCSNCPVTIHCLILFQTIDKGDPDSLLDVRKLPALEIHNKVGNVTLR